MYQRLVVAAVLALVAVNAGTSDWIKLANNGLGPQDHSSGAMVAGLNGHGSWKLFHFGGYLEDHSRVLDGSDLIRFYEVYNDFYAYNVVSQQWSPIALKPGDVKPSPRCFLDGVWSKQQKKMFIFGGAYFTGFYQNFVSYNELWSYDPKCNEWEDLSASWIPDPVHGVPLGRASHSVWFRDEELWIFGGVREVGGGGFGFNTLNDVWVINLDTLQWRQVLADGNTVGPDKRNIHGFAYNEDLDKTIVWSGERIDPPSVFTFFNDTWLFDHVTETWTEQTPLNVPPSVTHLVMGAYDDAFFFYGGDAPGGVVDGQDCDPPVANFFGPQNPLDAFWKFQDGDWTEITGIAKPPPSKRFMFAQNKKRFYIFGGWDFQDPSHFPEDEFCGQVWNNDVWKIDLSKHT